MYAKLDEELNDCPLEEEVASKLEEMKKEVAELTEDMAQENHTACFIRIDKTIVAVFAKAREIFIAYCNKHLPLPLDQQGKINESFEKIQKAGLDRVDKTLAELGKTIEMEEITTRYTDAKQSLADLLDLKLAQNESMNKEEAIKALETEVKDSNDQLETQRKQLEKVLDEEKNRSKELEELLKAEEFNAAHGGFLEKRGKFHKSFKTRFFKLDGSDLNYYKSGSMRTLQGAIDVLQATFEPCPADKDGKCCFEIKTPGRTYKIRAPSEKVRYVVR